MTKIVAIGVGSLMFGVELLRDVYQTPELRGAAGFMAAAPAT